MQVYTAEALQEGLQSAAQGFVEGMPVIRVWILADKDGTPALTVMTCFVLMPKSGGRLLQVRLRCCQRSTAWS